MRTLRSRWALLGLTLTLAACESKADIDATIPADGQQGVGARTVIAVRLSNTMSEADAGNTDSRNIAVQGDQTEGVYSGSIEPASFSDLFNGQTVEQFRQGERAPGAAGEEEPPADTTEGGEDALVFLLDEGTNFKAGELISVFVSPDVTVRGFPMEESLNFSFVVEGGDAAADTDLFVVSTDPSKDSLAVDLRPRITADFSLSVRGDSLEGGIAVRGQQSGFHAGGSALFDASRPLTDQATRVLDPLDSLRPGENVTVTWNGDISAGDDTSLSPFLLNFQVKPGEVLSAPDGRSGWQQIDLASTPSSVRVLLAGDFVRPLLEGDDLAEALEFVAVEPGSLELFVRNSSGTYSRRETVIEVPGRLVGAVTMDLNDDGLLEVVVVLEREGGLIVTYEIGDDGFLGRESDPVEFPAVNIDSVLAHDLNADGVPELLVTHGDTTFVPEPVDLLPDFDVPVEPAAPAEPKDTGHITFFERVEGLPPGGIDLNNPQTITTFLRVGRPIFGFTESRRVEAHDLDGDGRLDLVAETAEGIALYRNQSSPSQENPFAFRRVGLLSGPGGAPLQPVHWLVLDVDRDHDLDILSWDAEGLLFHENEQPPRRVPVSSPSSPRSSTPPRGILFENLPPVRFPSTLQLARGDLAAVSNVDGDPAGTPDVVVRREAGAVEIFLGSPDTIPPFVNAPLGFPGAGAGAAVALADINGDTGLDVLVASSLDIRALLTDPDLVVPVLLPVPSRFELVPRSLPDGGLEVSVMGDLETKFAGYALAVDYDASVVEYLGFVIPSSFERTASFDLCPDEALAGCAGIATATMAYRQGTVGVVSSGVPLGTFRFRPRPVEEITETIIELTDVESGERSFSNIVTASDAGLTHEVPVTELGEPVRLILNPPPPDPGAALDTECDVLQRLAKGYRARIRWDSPRRVPFDRVLIDVNGEPVPENPIPWGERSYELLDDRGGEVLITVTALTSGQSAVDPPESAP
ncbi:MAG: VCBS repeat-containing protein, partial [Planctomycetota bacterium]|nr:VCBS repeat-containing protein [Planctomycetota bacterium]